MSSDRKQLDRVVVSNLHIRIKSRHHHFVRDRVLRREDGRDGTVFSFSPAERKSASLVVSSFLGLPRLRLGDSAVSSSFSLAALVFGGRPRRLGASSVVSIVVTLASASAVFRGLPRPLFGAASTVASTDVSGTVISVSVSRRVDFTGRPRLRLGSSSSSFFVKVEAALFGLVFGASSTSSSSPSFFGARRVRRVVSVVRDSSFVSVFFEDARLDFFGSFTGFSTNDSSAAGSSSSGSRSSTVCLIGVCDVFCMSANAPCNFFAVSGFGESAIFLSSLLYPTAF